MWKAAAGQNVKVAVDDGGDDWETDPDFEVSPSSSRLFLLSPVPHVYAVWFCFFQNDVSEQEQRWGAKTVAGSGHQEHIESGCTRSFPVRVALSAGVC